MSNFHIPRSIKGRELTDAERKLCMHRKISAATLHRRANSGVPWSKLFEPITKHNKNDVYGYYVSNEMLEHIKTIGLTRQALYFRFRDGWSFEDATSVPKGGRRANPVRVPQPNAEVEEIKNERKKMTYKEVIEAVGRINYMNNNYEKYKDIPMIVPERLLIRAKEYGINVNEVKEVKV